MPRDSPETIATDRRRFLAAAGSVAAGSVALSGCTALSRTLNAPPIDWRTTLGSRWWVNSPLVRQGHRILATGEHRLVALDADSGDTRWHSRDFQRLLQGPVVTDGIAVIGYRRRGGYRADGTEVWHHSGDAVFRPLTAVDEEFVVGGRNAADGAITAIDPTDGSIRWGRTPDDWSDDDGSPMAYDAVTAGSGIAFAEFHGPLAGLSRDGSILWTRDDDWDVPGPGRPRLAATDDLAVAASGTIVGIDPATGNSIWRQVLPDWASGVTIADGVAYVSLGSDSPKVDAWAADGGLVAYDIADGTERWRSKLPDPTGEPAVDGEEVLVGTREGLLTAIDVKSGERRWERTLGSHVDTAPLVGESTTYVGVRSGEGPPEIVAMAR